MGKSMGQWRRDGGKYRLNSKKDICSQIEQRTTAVVGIKNFSDIENNFFDIGSFVF